MKRITIHYIYVCLACLVLLSSGSAKGEGIRIIPEQLKVANDSLHIEIRMDLNEVRVGRNMAMIFTPLLSDTGSRRLSLPSVIISGAVRDRQDRRELALSQCNSYATPYQRIRDNGKNSKNVAYRISLPYASWMQEATLLLKQESRECCGNELLAVDTLVRKLLPVAVSPKNDPVPTLDTVPQSPLLLPKESAFIAEDKAVAPVIKQTSVRETGRTTESVVLYFDYPIGKDDIHPDLKNNRYEIDKVDRLIAPLRKSNFVSVRSIRICGYCSPDGNYGDNERLAEARSRFFAIYLRGVYGIPRGLMQVSSVAEDWEGLTDLLVKENPAYRDAALQVITRYGVFNGREKYLMNLQGGVPYKDMLRHFFPRLRRIEVIVRYEEDNTKDE